MAIIVCIKQIPDNLSTSVNEQGKFERHTGTFCMNPADYYALEAAIQMKEKTGDMVIALSMGTMRSVEVLREAAAIGADEIILLNDEMFAGSDTQATSYILAMAIKKIGNVKAVFCGRQSKDGDTGQIGPELSEKLGFFIVTNALQIKHQDKGTFSFERQLDEGKAKGQGNYPAVFTMNRMIGECRVATITGVLKASKMLPTVWNQAALSLNGERCGRRGSPTLVTRICDLKKANRTQTEWKGNITDVSKKIMEKLILKKSQSLPTSKCEIQGLEIIEQVITINDITESEDIFVFAGSKNGEIMESVFQLIGHMKSQINESRQKIVALYIGQELPSNYKYIFGSGAKGIYWFPYNFMPIGNEAFYAEILVQAIKVMKPLILLFTATEFEKTLAAIIASRLDTGLTADCIDLQYDCEQKKLLQIRPVFSGMKKAVIICKKNPQMATVRPNVFPRPEISMNYDNSVWIKKVCECINKTKEKLERVQYWIRDGGNLQNAEIIFVGGKGLGDYKNYERMVKIAKELDISVGATRAVVDAGWAPYAQQIGLTGTVLRAKLCVLFGVSGAEEHVVGISNVDYIIAINLDTNANIFRYADVKVVCDAIDILKILEIISRNPE